MFLQQSSAVYGDGESEINRAEFGDSLSNANLQREFDDLDTEWRRRGNGDGDSLVWHVVWSGVGRQWKQLVGESGGDDDLLWAL